MLTRKGYLPVLVCVLFFVVCFLGFVDVCIYYWVDMPVKAFMPILSLIEVKNE